jgi:hypothetical protein
MMHQCMEYTVRYSEAASHFTGQLVRAIQLSSTHWCKGAQRLKTRIRLEVDHWNSLFDRFDRVFFLLLLCGACLSCVMGLA